MKRLLVIVDGSVQSSLALDEAIEMAQAFRGSEIVLLSIAAPAPAWQRRRADDPSQTRISERVTALALARTNAAGVPATTRREAGDPAEVAARIASAERCDHIFLPEQGPTPVARALMSVTGLSATSAASRILSLARLPVTVVSHAGRSGF
jgi:nucleotide-binding universal stress UspA family protein